MITTKFSVFILHICNVYDIWKKNYYCYEMWILAINNGSHTKLSMAYYQAHFQDQFGEVHL